MNHSFDIELAKEYGMDIAVLIQFFDYWLSKNEANEKNFHEGFYWTYNSVKAMGKIFPYMSERSISHALTKMIRFDLKRSKNNDKIVYELIDLLEKDQKIKRKNILISGNFNKIAYDQTKWFTFSPEFLEKWGHKLQYKNGNFNSQKCKLEETDLEIVNNKKCETYTNYLPITLNNLKNIHSDHSKSNDHDEIFGCFKNYLKGIGEYTGKDYSHYDFVVHKSHFSKILKVIKKKKSPENSLEESCNNAGYSVASYYHRYGEKGSMNIGNLKVHASNIERIIDEIKAQE